jgi:TonB-dependent starch-binding outer membrane protein SusC
MQKLAFCIWAACMRHRYITKTLLVMKLTIILLTAAFLNVHATGLSQSVTFSGKDVALEKVLNVVEKQTGYVFFYSTSVLKEARTITINAEDVPIEDFLQQVFKEQPLTFSIENKAIVISRKVGYLSVNSHRSLHLTTIELRGKIVNEQGEPVVASVMVKGTLKGTTTDEAGNFKLSDVDEHAILIVSGLSIQSKEVEIGGKTEVYIIVRLVIKELDATIVKGYYNTTRKLNTGSVGKITTAAIQRQPVSNVMGALEGQIPGMVVTQQTGVPGGNFSLEIRGQNSLRNTFGNNGNMPLIIVDGIPIGSASQSSSATSGGILPGGVSPLNGLNPADIESVEVLKDADATAIYGSRGANGVVLISTKKGKPGKTNVDVSIYKGIGEVTRMMKLLNTSQYVKMRMEAFGNDSVLPNPDYDPDVNGTWDTNHTTNWQKLMLGKKAQVTDVRLSVSGGNINTQFLVGWGYHKETTVFPGNFADQKGTSHVNVTHFSSNRRLAMSFSSEVAREYNNLFNQDLTPIAVYLPPNAPSFYDSTGKLDWNVPLTNPFSYLFQTYRYNSNLLLVNSAMSYELFHNLKVGFNSGYTKTDISEVQTNPLSSLNPAYYTNSDTYTNFANSGQESWIIEPQISWKTILGNGQLNFIAGTTFQQSLRQSELVNATGFNSDAAMENKAAAATVTVLNFQDVDYKYNAFFGRINYDWKEKYLLNVTGRKDGSSRFGPGMQFAIFGAIGAGWIFSQEQFLSHNRYLSFGKLRASYGTTGSDQIGDYQYLTTWAATSFPYQGTTGLYPVNSSNPKYAWEINKKFDFAIELGFFNNRILLSADYYKNRSSNQLVGYALPPSTGFNSVQANLNAVVQNSGVEVEITATNIDQEKFRWTTAFNLTIPRNKLISYPNIEGSSYANVYTVGKSLYNVKALHIIGVDPQTGVYQFADVNKDANITIPEDFISFKEMDRKLYGGLQNDLKYRDWNLDFFFQFVKQNGYNYMAFFKAPGTFSNQPTDVLSRWQKPGDRASVQRFTRTRSNPAFAAYDLGASGDNRITDASFIRLKNVALSYNLSNTILKTMKMQACRIYVQAQNLFVISNYLGIDPENNNVLALPPLRVLTAGIQVTF